MPPPLRTLRGIKDIRTRSGAPDQTVVPHKAYMVITVLEMEKFRRETERQQLITRLEHVSTRLRFIDAEKAAMLARLGKLPPRQGGVRRASCVKAPGPRAAEGFKFQY